MDDSCNVIEDVKTALIFDVLFEGLNMEKDGYCVVVYGVGCELCESDQVGVLT